jgi:hypothetical protein
MRPTKYCAMGRDGRTRAEMSFGGCHARHGGIFVKEARGCFLVCRRDLGATEPTVLAAYPTETDAETILRDLLAHSEPVLAERAL